jgi:carbonic anhydrase
MRRNIAMHIRYPHSIRTADASGPMRAALVAVILAAGFGSTLSPTTAIAADEGSIGIEQSPINISFEGLRFDRHLPALQFNYPRSLNLDCFNNSEVVRCNVPSGAATLRIGEETFNLLQFHWHTSSEHRLFGLTFPMEMHLVHSNASGQLLVTGVWFIPGAPNQELAKVFDRLPTNNGTRVTVSGFNLPSLLPRSTTSFRYRGSLTTPPFAEGVRWIVLDGVARAAPLQFNQYLSLFPGGNAREPQPLNGRTVSTDIGTRR